MGLLKLLNPSSYWMNSIEICFSRDNQLLKVANELIFLKAEKVGAVHDTTALTTLQIVRFIPARGLLGNERTFTKRFYVIVDG